MQCAEAREELTALADGALEAAEADAVRRHVRGCAACAAELAAIEEAVAFTREAFTELPELRPGFETRLRARLEEATAAPSWYRRLWRPLFVGALASLGVLLVARSVGGPSSVLVPLGIQAPPKKVAEKPVLFKDYEIIEHLDELENFETVIQTPLETDITGEDKSSG